MSTYLQNRDLCGWEMLFPAVPVSTSRDKFTYNKLKLEAKKKKPSCQNYITRSMLVITVVVLNDSARFFHQMEDVCPFRNS